MKERDKSNSPLLINRRDFLKLSRTFACAFGLTILKHEVGFTSINSLPESYTLDSVFPPKEFISEQTESIIKPDSELNIMLFPLAHNYNYKFWSDEEQTVPTEVVSLKLSKIPMLQRNLYQEDSDNNRIFSILPNSLTNSTLPIIIMSENGKNHFKPSSTKYEALYTILNDFYPNKILNILEGLKAIDEFQQNNDGFKAGEEYSMLKISDIKHWTRFVLGKDSAGAHVRAGGVCALATSICRTMLLAGATVCEQWEHPANQKYFSNPYAGPILSERNSDTTVDSSHNFRFKMNQSGYLKFTAEVITKGFCAPEFGNNQLPSDAYLVASLGFTKNKVPSQQEELETVKAKYREYRSKGGSSPTSIVYTPWSIDSKLRETLDGIYHEENVSGFEKELSSNKLFKDLVELRSLIHFFSRRTSGGSLGNYLEQTVWYKCQVDRLTKQNDKELLEDFVDTVKTLIENQTWVTRDQRLQCIGLSALVGALHHPNLPTVNVGNYPAKSVSALIPDKFRNNNLKRMLRHGFIFYNTENILDVKPGSHFININTNTPSGHIGVVLASKKIDGKTTLLCIDANASNDGLVRFFKVDENNWDNKFGPYPYKKYFIAPPQE